MQHTPLSVWFIFAGTLAIFLFLDLFRHRGRHVDTRREAMLWSAIWIGVGLAFCGFVWRIFGREAGEEYLAAYLMEKSLSVDNLFVFLVIFQSLRIPEEFQRTVLTWGIFGALIFRALFVAIGAVAIERYDWTAWVFGGILLIAALRMLKKPPPEQLENKTVRWLSRHMQVTSKLHGHHFVVRENNRRLATPLLIAAIGLEFTDILFAVDSVPAAFSVTRNPFIVYSSNAFAVLGLRSLYILLAHAIARLRYLHYGLAAVLAFAGLKLVTEPWIHVAPLVSVGIIAGIISLSAWVSLHRQA